MANEDVMDCPVCDAPAFAVKENPRGALSGSCRACGYQGFARSPKATAALKAKLAKRAPAGKPADDGDFLSKL